MIQVNFVIICCDIYGLKAEVDEHMLISEFINNLDCYTNDKEIVSFIQSNIEGGNRFRKGFKFSVGNELVSNLNKPFKDFNYNDEEDRALLRLILEDRSRIRRLHDYVQE